MFTDDLVFEGCGLQDLRVVTMEGNLWKDIQPQGPQSMGEKLFKYSYWACKFNLIGYFGYPPPAYLFG